MYHTHPTAEQRRLEALLASVERPGDYCVGGSLFTPMPRVIVEGAGELSFPLPEVQIEALIDAAERSPYEKGAETVTDTSVRDSWQIDAGDVRVTGRAWPDSLARIKDLVARGLGLSAERLGVRLYKLLLYRSGGFFAEHRDTEKIPGMVATLSLSLPTPGVGGDLVVRHAGRSTTFELVAEEPSELSFAAFYADCPHEVLPVRDGHRVSLLFNLTVASPEDRPAPPEHREVIGKIADGLARWRNDGGADKLAWVLDHEYSHEGLSFDTLKNRDAAVAQVLGEAADRADCKLHAAILTIEDRGRPSENPPDDWHGDDISEAPQAGFEEFHGRAREADSWVAPGGGRPRFGAIALAQREVVSQTGLTDSGPDACSVLPTGNEGVTMALAYRRGALVVWPADKTLDIVAENSVAQAVSWLADQCSGPLRSDGRRARQLLARLVSIWRCHGSGTSDRCEALRLLNNFGEADLIEDFLNRVVLIQYDGGENENEHLSEALPRIGVAEAAAFLAELIEKHIGRRPIPVVALLALAGRSEDAMTDSARRDVLREAVGSALAGLEAGLRAESEERAVKERRRAERSWYGRVDPGEGREWIDARALCDLFVLAHRLDLADEAVAAARVVAGHSEIVVPERMLATSVADMHERGGLADAAAYRVLWRHAADSLLARSATPPAEPADWVLDVEISCDCSHCVRLDEFCRDPVGRELRMEARGRDYYHLVREIQRHRPELRQEYVMGDTDFVTCRKTRAGHLQRMEEYAEDVRRMEALLPAAPDAERLEGTGGRVEGLETALGPGELT